MVYFLILILILFFAYKYDYLGKGRVASNMSYLIRPSKEERSCFLFLLFVFICVAAFRYRIGVDSVAYERKYPEIIPLDDLSAEDLFKSEYEPLYYLLASFARSITDEFWLLQLFQSLIVNIVMFRFIWRNINNKFVGVFLYYAFLYIPFTCEVMREACAVSMLLLGWEYLKKDKWLIFSIFLILAVGFHISAVALIIIPILKLTGLWKYMKVNSMTPFLLIGCYIIADIISKVFFDYILLLNISDNLNAKAEDYGTEEGSLNIFGMLSKLFQYVIFAYIAIKHFKYSGKDVPKNLEPLVLLCLMVQFFSFSITILYRYNNYLMPFTLICISDMFFDKSLYLSKKIKVLATGFVFWFLLISPSVFFHYYGLSETVKGSKYRFYMMYYPYHSVFTKDTDSNREQVFRLYGE